MKPAALRGTSTANEQQKFCEKTLKHQAEVDVESLVEEDKSRRNQEPGAAQQHRAADTVKEVAETQQVRSRQRNENLQNSLEIEHMRRLEPSKESEFESSKESDTARVADVKIHRQPSRADKLPSVKPMFDELLDLDQECEKLEHSLTRLQEDLELASTNKLE